jgi:hypothetical protein
MSTTDKSSIFAVPAVPIGPATEGQSDEYTGRITRQLCAAAYVRPDRLANVRSWVLALRAQLIAWVRKRLHLKPVAGPKASSPESEPAAPSVVLGPDYAMWVRKRITSQAHRIPTHAFDQGPVLRVCDMAIRQVRRRTATLTAVVLGSLGLAIMGWLPSGTAAILALIGCWLVYLADRYTAQQRSNALLSGGLPSTPSDPQSPALPYVREAGRGGPRDRFLGAGLNAWQEAVIGIDVEPAPKSQDDDEPATAFVPRPTAGSKNEDVAAAVLAALSQHGKRTSARQPMKHFRDTDLHAYIIKRLSDPAPTHDRLHPKLLIDVIGIAGISRDRWARLDDDAWRGLASLAANDKVSSLPGTDTARRYVWARITDWNGELVASVLVHFAYAGGFLRVTVRPHIMAPLNPAVDGLSSTAPLTFRWLSRAAVNAVGDIAVGINRLLRRRAPRPVPELGADPGPVSLREVYSLRRTEDMHMNDDARYYVQMMQRRVFDSTEIFLRDHNVDIAAYTQQATAIYNFGVMNGGTMNGAVQAAPFSNDAQMS